MLCLSQSNQLLSIKANKSHTYIQDFIDILVPFCYGSRRVLVFHICLHSLRNCELYLWKEKEEKKRRNRQHSASPDSLCCVSKQVHRHPYRRCQRSQSFSRWWNLEAPVHRSINVFPFCCKTNFFVSDTQTTFTTKATQQFGQNCTYKYHGMPLLLLCCPGTMLTG